MRKLDRVEREWLSELQSLALRNGYAVEFSGRRRQRKNGWPVDSAKPFALYITGGRPRAHIASFATMEQLERNLRARAGI